MTATALALDPASLPALDMFDDVNGVAPVRPQLRLIEGQGFDPTPARSELAQLERVRRRRFLALLAATLLVLGGAWAAGVSVTSFGGVTAPAATSPAATTSAASEAIPVVHVVLPGDSYGAIAAELGASNPIAAAEVLRSANGGGELVVGQRLMITASVNAAVLQAGA